MIGYSVQKIESLIGDLNDSYYQISESIINGWGDLTFIIESEWIGPDAVAYEKFLANELISFYQNCFVNINNIINNIVVLSNNWIEFNSDSYIDSGYDISKNRNNNFFNRNQIKKYDISNYIKVNVIAFNEKSNMGLMHGLDSSKKIKNQFNVYISDIQKSLQNLYKNFNCSTAFTDRNFSYKFNKYVKGIFGELITISNAQITLDENLDKLINKYKENQDAQILEINKTIRKI